MVWLLLTPSLTSRQLPSCPLCFCRAEVLSTESLGGSTEPLDTSCPLPLRACPHHKGKLPCQVGTCSPGPCPLTLCTPREGCTQSKLCLGVDDRTHETEGGGWQMTGLRR